MGDPLKPINSGDPLPRRATTWNLLLDAARDYRSRRGGSAGEGAIDGAGIPALEITIRNNTGSALDVFAVVKIGAPLVSPVDEPFANCESPAFEGETPTGPLDLIGVLQVPLGVGEMGRARVGGITYASINPTTTRADEWYLIPTTGAPVFEGAQNGHPILWRDSGRNRAMIWLRPGPLIAAMDGYGDLNTNPSKYGNTFIFEGPSSANPKAGTEFFTITNLDGGVVRIRTGNTFSLIRLGGGSGSLEHQGSIKPTADGAIITKPSHTSGDADGVFQAADITAFGSGGNVMRHQSSVPSGPTAAGSPKTLAYDGSNLWLCIASGDWVSIPVGGSVAVNSGGGTNMTGYVKGNGSTLSAVASIPNADISGLGTAATRDAGSAGGVATLDGGGKLPASQLPDLAITEFLGTVANQTAMLALTGQRGDWAIRSDLNTVFVLVADTPSSLSSWRQLAYPGSTITLAGETYLSLSGSDLTANKVNLSTHTDGSLPLNKIATVAGLSVLGKGGSAAGAPDELTAGTDGHVLRRLNSLQLSFGTIGNSSVTVNSLQFDRLNQLAANRVLGNPTGSTANIQGMTVQQVLDLLSTTTDRVMVRTATGWEARTVSQVLDMISATTGAVAVRTSSGWSVVTPSSVGDVLTLATAGSHPVFTPPPTNDRTEAHSGANFNIAAAFGTWVDVTGLSVSVAGPGKMRISARIRYVFQGNTAGLKWISCRFWNQTTGAAVANSESILFATSVTGQSFQGTVAIEAFVDIATSGTTEFRLQASRNGTGTFTTSDIQTLTSICAMRLTY
jgi:hypothetical protein